MIEKIENILKKGLPEAEIEMLDPMNDGVHLIAKITSEIFIGKSLVEQHRIVMNLLKEDFKGDLHALSIRTKTPKTNL